MFAINHFKDSSLYTYHFIAFLYGFSCMDFAHLFAVKVFIRLKMKLEIVFLVVVKNFQNKVCAKIQTRVACKLWGNKIYPFSSFSNFIWKREQSQKQFFLKQSTKCSTNLSLTWKTCNRFFCGTCVTLKHLLSGMIFLMLVTFVNEAADLQSGELFEHSVLLVDLVAIGIVLDLFEAWTMAVGGSSSISNLWMPLLERR